MHLKSFFNWFKKNYLSKWGLLELFAVLLVFTLPVSKALSNILLVPVIALMLINYQKIKIKIPRYLVFLLLAALWLFFMEIWEGTLPEDIRLFRRLGIVFVSFFLIYNIRNKQEIKLSFLAGCLFSVLGSLVTITYYYLTRDDFTLSNGGMINDMLWQDRPYLGFSMVLGIYLVLISPIPWFKKVYNYGIAFILLFFIVLIAARLAIILGVGVFVYHFISTSFISRRNKIIGSLAFFILLLSGVTLNPNIKERMKIKNSWETTYAQFVDFEARFVIWPCAVEVLKKDNNWVTGIKNREEIREELSNCYAASIQGNKSKKKYFLKTAFYEDNQFLSFFLWGGFVPFLLLLAFFVFGWISKKPTSHAKAVLLLFFFFFMATNVLTRQLGCFLLGSFLGLYTVYNDKPQSYFKLKKKKLSSTNS